MPLTRSILSQHREIAAVVITYGVFLSGLLVLAWAMT
jgi:hypothetical protein